MAKGGWSYSGDYARAMDRLEDECDRAAVTAGSKVVSKSGNKAPKRTTALSKSGFVIGKGKNTYEAAKAEASAANPDASFVSPEVEREQSGISSATIGFATDYAAPVHDGHLTRSGSFVAPRPFLANELAAGEELLETEGERALERAFTGR